MRGLYEQTSGRTRPYGVWESIRACQKQSVKVAAVSLATLGVDFASLSDQRSIAMRTSVASGIASVANVAANAVNVELSARSVEVDTSIRAAILAAIQTKLSELSSTSKATIAANGSQMIGLPTVCGIFVSFSGLYVDQILVATSPTSSPTHSPTTRRSSVFLDMRLVRTRAISRWRRSDDALGSFSPLRRRLLLSCRQYRPVATL